MGACLSCLGISAGESSSDPGDTHPLLQETAPDYGTGNHTTPNQQIDTEALRIQRENLERLCAATSDKLIDVTQPLHHHLDEGGRPPKLGGDIDYSRLFAEQFASSLRSAHSRKSSEGRPDSDSTLAEQQQDEEDDMQTLKRLLDSPEAKELATWKKPKDLGSLSLTFEDLMGFSGKAKALA